MEVHVRSGEPVYIIRVGTLVNKVRENTSGDPWILEVNGIEWRIWKDDRHIYTSSNQIDCKVQRFGLNKRCMTLRATFIADHSSKEYGVKLCCQRKAGRIRKKYVVQ